MIVPTTESPLPQRPPIILWVVPVVLALVALAISPRLLIALGPLRKSLTSDVELTRRTAEALVLAGDRHFIANTDGELQVRATADGKLLDECSIPVPLWDGLAVVGTRIYLSTKDGGVMCIGE